MIVTFNTRDFPEQSLAEFDIEAKHPDDFILESIDLARGTNRWHHRRAGSGSQESAADRTRSTRYARGAGTRSCGRKPSRHALTWQATPTSRSRSHRLYTPVRTRPSLTLSISDLTQRRPLRALVRRPPGDDVAYANERTSAGCAMPTAYASPPALTSSRARRSSSTSSICSSAARRSSAISSARTSGSGRLAESSRLSSRSQKRSRLTLSRATSSS